MSWRWFHEAQNQQYFRLRRFLFILTIRPKCSWYRRAAEPCPTKYNSLIDWNQERKDGETIIKIIGQDILSNVNLFGRRIVVTSTSYLSSRFESQLNEIGLVISISTDNVQQVYLSNILSYLAYIWLRAPLEL